MLDFYFPKFSSYLGVLDSKMYKFSILVLAVLKLTNSFRNLPGAEGWPAHKADNLTDICGPFV
jgi:hypothetical protein